ncbi:NAD(P)H-dependent oxidoreductase [Antarcticibacterium sp. 1MA-6-2]|uniref:NAD(P)H-dependent oxidoreductase n=1 Tax=Antarcticibacterium sp. 1MA-6-2 TaxID=2908210 RepID=UPI001F1E3518|nr:NAD(P)H-dependent oxidoreductase [Antarcticibacterium sp. 1MA-6-2]UJH92936.1 NAD(P)H-dependent oxidoreductase [Antarcticibacterium sp. 1MA-6-2]
MENIKALKWRYATKKFDSQKLLPKGKIEVLKNAFNLTATSYGLQPIKLVIIQNKELQEKLVKYSFNQKQVATASHVLVICIENKVDREFIERYFKRVHAIRATPADILQPFQNFLIGDFEKKHIDEISVWATNQAYLALGTLMTVCATEAIDACPMEGFEPKEYNDLLGLEDRNLESVLVLPVGYRAKDDMFSEFEKVRRPLSDVIIEL